MSPPSLESTPVVSTGAPVSDDPRLPALNRAGHAAHCVRCLDGLPASLVEMDASRMAIAFYCLGTLDLTGLTEQKISPTDRQSWKEWIWNQYVEGGFLPGPFVSGREGDVAKQSSRVAAPHLIMTYCALLALAVLRDDYAQLDRAALARLVGACQDADGGCVTHFPPPFLLPLASYTATSQTLTRPCAQIFNDSRSG